MVPAWCQSLEAPVFDAASESCFRQMRTAPKFGRAPIQSPFTKARPVRTVAFACGRVAVVEGTDIRMGTGVRSESLAGCLPADGTAPDRRKARAPQSPVWKAFARSIWARPGPSPTDRKSAGVTHSGKERSCGGQEAWPQCDIRQEPIFHCRTRGCMNRFQSIAEQCRHAETGWNRGLKQSGDCLTPGVANAGITGEQHLQGTVTT